MHMPYLPALGGANKSNRYLAEALARKQHSVTVVVPALGTSPGGVTKEQFLQEKAFQGIACNLQDGVYNFQLNGVNVNAVLEASALSRHLTYKIDNFQPDCIIIALEDTSLSLLIEALKTSVKPIVGIAQTPTLLPFGPYSFYPSVEKTALLDQIDVIVTNSKFLNAYVQQWSSLRTVMFRIPAYGCPPYPSLANFDESFVTLVNPCKFKGISIFIELAKKLPAIQFAAVPTWGTTIKDIKTIQDLNNVHLLKPCSNFNQILEQTRILLVPSLWLENIPLTITEAMLRGIPVICSNVGGIPEINLNTGFMIPVNPISCLSPEFAENDTVIPLVPAQDIAPWYSSLLKLIADKELYYCQSTIVREAASKFVSSITIDPFEEFLERLVRSSNEVLS